MNRYQVTGMARYKKPKFATFEEAMEAMQRDAIQIKLRTHSMHIRKQSHMHQTDEDILGLIRRNPGITATKIAVAFGVPKEVIQVRMSRMEGRGQVKAQMVVNKAIGRRERRFYVKEAT